MSSSMQGIHNYDASPQSTSAGALFMLLQVLPQLQAGWNRAEQEVRELRRTLTDETERFHKMEIEYAKKILSLTEELRNSKADRDHIKNILVNTTIYSENLNQEANKLALNFSIEKEKVMQILTEKNDFILNHTELLKNVSTELRSLNSEDASIEVSNETESDSNYEHDIKNNLASLKALVMKIKTELSEKEKKISDDNEKIDELEEEYESCKDSNKELQEEVDVAKEVEEELQQVKVEKEELKKTNEKLLRQILSVLETSTKHQNVMIETILKESSSASRGIQKYIVEPAEKAYNSTIKSILNNLTPQAALIRAAQKGNVTEMSLLLDHGADIEVDDQEKWRYRPLHWAANEGHREAAKLLILRGADVDARTAYNSSALHIAVLRRHRNIIDLLLKGGANIEAQDSAGSTPLAWAAEKEDCEIGRLLVDRGANATAVYTVPDCLRLLLCSKGVRDPACSTDVPAVTTTALPTESAS